MFSDGDWGLGIGDWGLGIGVLGVGAKPQTPKPQTPQPNPQYIKLKKLNKYIKFIN